MKRALLLIVSIISFCGTLYAQCDTIIYLRQEDSVRLFPINYGPPYEGYVMGNNSYNDQAKANMFGTFQPSTVEGAVMILHLGDNYPNVWHRVAVLSSIGNFQRPDKIIAIDSFTTNDIRSFPIPGYDGMYRVDVAFTEPPLVDGIYYIALLMDTTINDTLAVYHTQRRDDLAGITSQAWTQEANGSWMPYDESQVELYGSLSTINNLTLYLYSVACEVQTLSASITDTLWSGACYGNTRYLKAETYNAFGSVQYLWTPGHLVSDSTARITSVVLTDTTGPITLRVIDFQDTAYITHDLSVDPIPTISGVVNNAVCAATPSSSIELTVSGSSAPYRYEWVANYPFYYSKEEDPNDLEEAMHYLTVTTGNGCQYYDSFYVSSPSMGLELDIHPDTCGNSIGSIAYVNMGGNPSITYNWAGGATSNSLTGLADGQYVVTVTDGNAGCSDVDTIQLGEVCYNLIGKVYADVNTDGVFNANDRGLAGVVVHVGTGESAITNSMGDYYINVSQLGNNTVSIDQPNGVSFCTGWFQYQYISPSIGYNSIALTLNDPIANGVDFAMQGPNIAACGQISGFVFEDLNSNGVQDAGEQGLPDVIVSSEYGVALPNADGAYSLHVPLDQPNNVEAAAMSSQPCYNNAVGLPLQVYPTSGNGYNITLNNAMPVSLNNNFGMALNGGFDAGLYGFSPFNSSNTQQQFVTWLGYERKGGPVPDCVLKVDFDGTYLTFDSATISPDAVSSGSLEFNFSSLDTLGYGNLFLVFSKNANTPAGYQYDWQAYFTCSGADVCIENDTIDRTSNFLFTPKEGGSSNDLGPTFMRSFTNSDLTDGDITSADTAFTYLMQFANTSTEGVEHIVIVDTIPSEFRLLSLTRLYSNEEMEYAITPDGVLTIVMDDVELRNGLFNNSVLIQYNVVLQQQLPLGTVIHHRAQAYYNRSLTPVYTNYAINRIVDPTGVEEQSNIDSFTLFPNPSSGTVTLQLEKHSGKVDIRVLDLSGRVVQTAITEEQVVKLDLLSSGAGIYFVEVTTDDGKSIQKLVLTK